MSSEPKRPRGRPREFRQTGLTTNQIKRAPQKAVYIWVNGNFRYVRDLARLLGRTDLEFVSPSWLGSYKWRGRKISAIIVDHAARLSGDQWLQLHEIRNYQFIRGLTPNR